MTSKFIVFDLDGTLVDTLSDITSALNSMLDYYSFPLHSEKEVSSMIGHGARNLVKKALPHDLDASFVDEALERYRKIYDDNIVVKTRVYDGLYDVLLELHARGTKMAIVSNKDDFHVRTIAKKLLPDVFEITMGYSPKYERKPHPESVLAVVNEMGGTPEESAYVGDMSVDVQTAKNAGMKAVGVAWGILGENSFSEKLPDILIREARELLTI